MLPTHSKVSATGTTPGFGSVFSDVGAGMSMEVTRSAGSVLEFTLRGVDAPIANALRRILLSEVPSVAVETVYVLEHSGVMQEEVLCHRLGLVPLHVDAEALEAWKSGDEFTSRNCLVFSLDVAVDGDEVQTVWSRDLVWEPQEGQEALFGSDPPRVEFGDIPITRLRPGQAIKLQARAVKSNGADHAKFSPVATAAYKMAPRVTLVERKEGEEEEGGGEEGGGEGGGGFWGGERGEELVKRCPMGVFEIEESGKAVVAHESRCTMCRECVREPAWQPHVALALDHRTFHFTVEAVSEATPPHVLVKRALLLLAAKARLLQKQVRAARSDRGEAGEEGGE